MFEGEVYKMHVYFTRYGDPTYYPMFQCLPIAVVLRARGIIHIYLLTNTMHTF